MPDSHRSASGWGWFALIAVVALIGGGWLYQREGGKLFGPAVKPNPDAFPKNNAIPAGDANGKPLNGEKPNADKAPAPQPGHITFAFDNDWDKGASAYGPWLYIRGELVKDYGYFTNGHKNKKNPAWVGGDGTKIEDKISLPPATYFVELVWAGIDPTDKKAYKYGPDGYFPFPLWPSSATAVVTANDTVRIKWENRLTRLPVGSVPDRLRIDPRQIGYGTHGLHYRLFLDQPERELPEQKRWMQENYDSYQKHPVRIVLEKMRQEIEKDPPKKSVIHVPLPGAYTGGRELNADQIDMIIGWLKDLYFPVYGIGPGRPGDPGWNDWNERHKGQPAELISLQNQYRARVDDLNEISRKLRSAPQ